MFGGHALHIDSPATKDVAIADLAAKWVCRPVLCLSWYHIHMREQEERALGPVSWEPCPQAGTARRRLKSVCVDIFCCELLTDIGDSRPFVPRRINGVALDKRLKDFYCLSSKRIPIHFSCFNCCHRMASLYVQCINETGARGAAEIQSPSGANSRRRRPAMP